MTVTAQLELIRDKIRELWGTEGRRPVEIASDPMHLFGMFADTAPNGARAVVMFTGEQKRGDYEEIGAVDRSFLVVITSGRGMVDKGDATRAGVGYTPLYSIFESARQAVRAIEWPVREEGQAGCLEGIADYKSAGIFQLPDGRPVDAMQMEFSIGVLLPTP